MKDEILFYTKPKDIKPWIELIKRNTRTLCDNIGPTYWTNVEKEIDSLYIYGRPMNPYSQGSELIKGFLIGKHYPDHVHLLLVCAKTGTRGIGLQLMDRFIADAKAQGLQRVTLDALPQVIQYYRKKYGFKLSKQCEESHDVTERLSVLEGRPPFRSMDDTFEDPEMVQLLNLVIESDLSADPKCKQLKAAEDPDYLQVCSSSGYFMTLCLDQPKKRKASPKSRGKRIKVA